MTLTFIITSSTQNKKKHPLNTDTMTLIDVDVRLNVVLKVYLSFSKAKKQNKTNKINAILNPFPDSLVFRTSFCHNKLMVVTNCTSRKKRNIISKMMH